MATPLRTPFRNRFAVESPWVRHNSRWIRITQRIYHECMATPRRTSF